MPTLTPFQPPQCRHIWYRVQEQLPEPTLLYQPPHNHWPEAHKHECHLFWGFTNGLLLHLRVTANINSTVAVVVPMRFSLTNVALGEALTEREREKEYTSKVRIRKHRLLFRSI